MVAQDGRIPPSHSLIASLTLARVMEKTVLPPYHRYSCTARGPVGENENIWALAREVRSVE